MNTGASAHADTAEGPQGGSAWREGQNLSRATPPSRQAHSRHPPSRVPSPPRLARCGGHRLPPAAAFPRLPAGARAGKLRQALARVLDRALARVPAIAFAIIAGFCLVCGPARADEIRILVQRSPLAGSQYYALSSAWREIRVGDRLALVREADNRHDANAIRVEWNGRQLGYVPRAENRALAAAIDRGDRVEARVVRLTRHRNPWQRVEFEVYVLL